MKVGCVCAWLGGVVCNAEVLEAVVSFANNFYFCFKQIMQHFALHEQQQLLGQHYLKCINGAFSGNLLAVELWHECMRTSGNCSFFSFFFF